MDDVRVVMSRGAVKELLNSAGVQRALLAEAKRVRSNAGGDGYKVDVQPGKTRAHARVSTTTWEQWAHERKHNSLLKASGGGV